MREETEFKNILHIDNFNDIIGAEVSGGSRVGSVSQHAKARMIQRKISSEYIRDALRNPDIVTPVKYDDLGRPSMQYVKDRNLIYYNPVDKVVTSVRRAKEKEVEKLRRLYDKMIRINFDEKQATFLSKECPQFGIDFFTVQEIDEDVLIDIGMCCDNILAKEGFYPPFSKRFMMAEALLDCFYDSEVSIDQ